MAKNIDITEYNRDSWNREVDNGNEWTLPVSTEEVNKAKEGDAKFLLTPEIFVPESWYADIKGKKALLLASGGGQQGPLFAALGADVTVFDNSENQLSQDRMVAERDGLDIKTVQGDMKDLSVFDDETFDFIFHPVSNCFVPDINPVWEEAYRVLKKGGTMIAGFTNPVAYIFDFNKMDIGELEVKYKIPYSDTEQLPRDELEERMQRHEALEYGHSLDDQIGGQLRAGFHLIGFYEDKWDAYGWKKLSEHIAGFIATRALKPL